MKALWLIIALCLSVVVAVTMAEAQQCSRPLIRTQIERALAIPVPDEAIALEIRTCGLDFTPDAEYVEKLHGLKVFPLTTKAVEALLPKAPKPIPTPLRKPTPTLPVGSDFTETVNGVQLAMVRLPGGAFTMGSNDDSYHEKPPHRVTVSAFAIGKYEVTQAQWQAVMGNNPSQFKGDNLPVENVSWEEAQEFCRKLGNGYRLPAEAEWEYAARAGSTGKWSFGNDVSRIGEYAWRTKDTSGYRTHPVGQKKANGFGLFDVYGNVSEWCEDDWHDDYNGAPTDGSAWKPADTLARGSDRVVRSGDCYFNAYSCTSTVRTYCSPGKRSGIGFLADFIGFRLARTLR